MANIGEITQGSSYRGDPALGNGLGVGVTIDSSPLQRLATFSYYAKRDQWEQKQKDNVVAAGKIANMAAFDITSPFTEYSTDLRGRLERMQKFVRENPDSLVYSRSPQKYLEREEMENDFRNKRKIATVNDTLYNAAKAKVELMPNGAQKDIAKERLNLRAKNLFSDGLDVAYNRQFEETPPPKPESSIIPTVGITTRETFLKLPNDNVTVAVTYHDLDDVRAKSRLIATGGQIKDIKNTDWFKNLPPDEQRLALKENELPLTELREIEGTAASINSLFAQWQAAHQDIDIDTVDLNSLPNDSFGNQIRAARALNSQIDELNSLVVQGAIKDPSGKVRTIPYEHFNLKDGLSSEEIISMASLQASKIPLIQKVDKTVQATGDDLDRQRLGLGWFNAQTGRIQEDRLADAAGVDKDMAKSAKAYAEALFSKMKSLANTDGIIPKSNLSKFTLDELKYLGLGTTTENKFSLDPLDLTGVSSILIDPDGTIKTFTGGTGRSLGTQKGTPINISTIATNKLGDEMTVTAGKEGYNFNNLIPLYQSGSTDVQKQATIQETELSTNPADWKQDGNNWRYKDGRIFDSKGKEVKK